LVLYGGEISRLDFLLGLISGVCRETAKYSTKEDAESAKSKDNIRASL
jgi:hypothetical protein